MINYSYRHCRLMAGLKPCKSGFCQSGTLAKQAKEEMCRALYGKPGSSCVLTCDMQLVQPVIGQGCIPRTALSFILKASCSGWGSPPALEDFFQYPAYQAQLLQAVPDHIPGETAGQV